MRSTSPYIKRSRGGNYLSLFRLTPDGTPGAAFPTRVVLSTAPLCKGDSPNRGKCPRSGQKGGRLRSRAVAKRLGDCRLKTVGFLRTFSL